MINKDKWIDSLPGKNTRFSNTINQLDHDKWIKTIPKKKSHNSVRKYSLMSIVFVCGLLFVSVIKNETRNLQKEINNLETSINLIKFNLDQAFLDNEVITSPENISRLAKEYLNINFISYKRNQIKRLSDDMDVISEPVEKDVSSKSVEKNEKFSENLKKGIVKKIEKKRTEIRKLQELYAQPETIPGEIKIQVAKKIKKKKTELKKLYSSPKEVITLEKAQKWAAVQVVKVFLGMPIIPGK